MSTSNSSSSQPSVNGPGLRRSVSTRDPQKDEPQTQTFGYGADCTHHGWMKKRRTKMLRHEWQDAHFRLTGSQLAMHNSDRLSSATLDTLNVEDYAIACQSAASSGKLSAAMRAFHLRNANSDDKKARDAAAFAFQLIPEKGRERAVGGKTHHFAVKSQTDRIDWMRELMLAQAMEQKGKGYDVEINRFQVPREQRGKAFEAEAHRFQPRKESLAK